MCATDASHSPPVFPRVLLNRTAKEKEGKRREAGAPGSGGLTPSRTGSLRYSLQAEPRSTRLQAGCRAATMAGFIPGLLPTNHSQEKEFAQAYEDVLERYKGKDGGNRCI